MGVMAIIWKRVGPPPQILGGQVNPVVLSAPTMPCQAPVVKKALGALRAVKPSKPELNRRLAEPGVGAGGETVTGGTTGVGAGAGGETATGGTTGVGAGAVGAAATGGATGVAPAASGCAPAPAASRCSTGTAASRCSTGTAGRSSASSRSRRPAWRRTRGPGTGTTGCSRARLARFRPIRSATYALLSGNSEYLDVARVCRRRRIRIIQDARRTTPNVDIRIAGDRDEEKTDRYKD